MPIRTGVTRLIVLTAVAWTAAACALTAPTPVPSASPPAVAETVAVVPTNAAPIATRVPPTRLPITDTNAITLTLWTAEDLAPGTTAAGSLLRNQFDAFTAANPNIHIDATLKKPYGKGGLLDFLTTTSLVVPDQLPDIAALDISEVPPAASAGILQPLDALLSPEVKGDLFPFAYQAANYQGKWVAVPFSADIEHLVYDKRAVKKAPSTWDELYKQKASLLLPIGGDNVFLLQYLALAPLYDSNNQMTVDPNAAAQVLSFFKRVHDQSLIPDTAIGLKSAEEAWPIFASGKVTMTQALASRYLTNRDKLPDAGYAAVPTRDGKAVTIASGWAYGIVTRDPIRQAAAARFIQWIVQGGHLAPWLRIAHRLPASRATLILAADPVEYAAFLRDELEHAVYLPPNAAYAKAADAWRAAILAVWKDQATPEEAARSIAAALK
ncbi:MAG: extracellular solute-binding protein [Chloroflexota bacterium]|nr:extracellular solute-binding protein [Chloroflexota bacterium]